MTYIISGIQQIGIGVTDAEKAWTWYRRHFDMDVPVFKDAAEAKLMTRYTSGKVEARYAILAINMNGGGGFEIWQYTSKVPVKPEFDVVLGDTGIYATKIKSRAVEEKYHELKAKGANIISELSQAPDGRKNFFLTDPYGNLFEIVESTSWFKLGKSKNGGVSGCVMGVSDVDKAIPLYRDVLGYSVVYDTTETFKDFKGLPGGEDKFRRVLLRGTKSGQGNFGRLLGATEIELVQVLGRTPRKIFGKRNWGDLGFIHMCFDVNGMKELGKKAQAAGFPFTVDSSTSFDMGKAAGQFTYIEDPDGTLIEFVETHKIPIFEKIGWYISLKKRNPEKPLPNWMVGMLSLNRVKD